MKRTLILGSLALAALTGCHHSAKNGSGGGSYAGPGADRPFPIGQVTYSFWETQQTNAEAADFIFYDHEFRGNTAELSPGAKKHLMQVALRLEHVPFPVVIEESPGSHSPAEIARRQEIDQARRQTIVEQLARECGMDLRVLDARQDVGWAAALPLGLAPSTLFACSTRLKNTR